MSNPNTPAVPRGGLSLYANLLDPSSSSNTAAIISRAPVAFHNGASAPDEEASAKKQQINAAALRFQPTKRPQLSSQKGKPKPAFPRAAAPVSLDSTKHTLDTPAHAASRPVKSTLADWAIAGDDDDVNGFYGGGEKRQRGGRKRRKKNREEYTATQDWDDIYDPSRPNNYDEYKHSDEQIREVREWKERLYAHRKTRKYTSDLDSEDEYSHQNINSQFAPPPSFAPPQTYAPAPPSETYNDQTGDDAYTRRVNLSQNISSEPTPGKSSPAYSPPPPDTLPPSVISRAPVRYSLPEAPLEIPTSEAELERALAESHSFEADEDETPENQPRSSRPGQAGFAARLMSKYGWSKGSGLGADGSGIVNALHVQVQKRKKKPDSEGGGFADPKGIGKIVGGRRNTPAEQAEGKFGTMSEVVILKGMVDGMNLDDEVEGPGDGGLMQEIGDECGEKYGNVERVFINRSSGKSATVFVKFTSQLSGLRAVNALEGRTFNGNTISARFYDAEKFEEGIYE